MKPALVLVALSTVLLIMSFWSLISEEENYDFPARMYKPITSLPAYQGGFGEPIDNINDVPQLAQMQQAVYQGTWGDDSVANLKLTSQHTNLIRNML
jgi:hypothetical protein